MIASIFTPDGIVISTIDSDSFYQKSRRNGEDNIDLISIVGHPHVITFWNKYAMVFHQVSEFQYQNGINYIFSEVMLRWQDRIPPIYEVMPYIKKVIMENNLELIGIMAGYSNSECSKLEPYVYQILGNEIRRINTNEEGRVAYNFVFLEKETSMGRLLRHTQVKNGNEWEKLEPLSLRCDLFSVQKALELTEFFLITAENLKHLNSSNQTATHIENVIITPDKLTLG